MATIAEELRNEFYRWEAIGRGEKIWDFPVQPEPYFVPFYGHGAFVDVTAPSDTGVKPSLLDRAKNLVKASKVPKQIESYSHLLDQLDVLAPPDEIMDFKPLDGLIELRLVFPEGVKLCNKRFEQFLYSLGSLQHPVSFEILGVAELITIQFVVAPDDVEIFCANFEAFHPDIGLLHPGENQVIRMADNLADGEFVSRELALEREFFKPCRLLRDFSIDPYQGIFAALSLAQQGEFVVLQTLIQPCLGAWSKSLRNLVTTENGKAFFPSHGEDLRSLAVKTSKPMFGVVVRLAAFADSTHRCRELLRPIASSFENYEAENGFVLADEFECGPLEKIIDLQYRLSRRSGMILNTDELLGLVHLPGPDVYSSKFERIVEDAPGVPDELHRDEGLCIGMGDSGTETRPVVLSPNERLRHIHCIGASGVGKSTLITSSIVQDLEAGHGLALLDPHGDLVSTVLDHIPEHRREDVVLFDPTDEEFPIGFNMLSARTYAEKNILASDFVSIIQRLSTSWGDNMSSVLGNAVMAFLESPEGGTLLDLRKFLGDEAFRNGILETVTEPEVKYFWQYEFPLVKGSAQASLITRLGSFLRQKLLRNLVAQKGEKLDFAKIMNERKIFLAPLAQGLIGEECSFLIGSTLVSKFYQTALARQEMAESDREPFFLYLDEAHNFVTPSIASILSGARKYGLGLVLAHQDLEQFRSRSQSTLSSVLTNAHTRICFKLGDQDARKLEEGFEHFGANDLRKLGRGEAVCRVGGSQNDFFLRTPPPLPRDEDALSRRSGIIEFSRRSYGTPRAEVEASLATYYAPPPPKKKVARKKAEVLEKPSSKPPEPHKKETSSTTKEETKPVPDPPKPEKHAEKKAGPEEKKFKSIPMLSPAAVAQAAPYQSLKTGQTPGRGGPVHKAIQAQIKQQANSLGFRASIEAMLPGNEGSIDVLLEGKTVQVAIEIALQSPISQEVRNIEKCLKQNFSEIIVVSESRDHLEKIRGAAREVILSGKLSKVRFLELSELSQFLSEFGASLTPSETETLGYKVTTKFVQKSKTEVEERKNRIHEMIARTRKNLEGE